MVAKKVWFEGERIYIETDDGRTLWQSILYYQRLRNATKEQREDYELGAFGIHWEEIDEDDFLQRALNMMIQNRRYLPLVPYTPGDKRFGCCPTDGDAQSLLAQYIRGIKRPSKEREQAILNTVREIGKELSGISI